MKIFRVVRQSLNALKDKLRAPRKQTKAKKQPLTFTRSSLRGFKRRQLRFCRFTGQDVEAPPPHFAQQEPEGGGDVGRTIHRKDDSKQNGHKLRTSNSNGLQPSNGLHH